MKTTAQFFKALSDETRLRILALLVCGELCVCDLMAVLDLPQSTVSRHLAYLRHAGLVEDRLAGAGEAPVLTRARHREALEEAAGALARALEAPPEAPELLAEDMRLALRELGRITGRVDVEELLDVVFRDFCIGK